MQLCSAYTWHDALARMEKPGLARHLERRLAVSGLQRCPGCHPERSEGSLREARQTLRCAQGDRPSLQMSRSPMIRLQETPIPGMLNKGNSVSSRVPGESTSSSKESENTWKLLCKTH